jgi:putative addiction module component (TIGR02574 family)
MTMADLTRAALELSVDEQLDLAQTLWDHAAPPMEATIPPELRDLLEARLQEAERNPEAGVPWEEALARLRSENPYLYPTIHRKIRRASLNRFPYGVYYAPIAGDLHVLAVVHDARHPSVWKRRK